MAGIRIGGLASGMDIDSLVSDLMKAERIPLDKLSQKKQFLEWQRDDYRDINKSLLELDRLIFDGILKKGSYTNKNVTVSHSDLLSVKNITSTTDFSGSMVISELATAATLNSGTTNITSSSSTLSTFGITGEQTINIKAINKEGKMEETGYSLTFDPTVETMDSLISKINSYSGVSAFFDNNTQKISFIAKNTGSIDDVTIAGEEPEIVLDSTTGFWTNLNIAPNNTGIGGIQGTNAKVKYNGLDITRSSNTFSINGIEFTLQQANPAQAISFSSTPDTDSMMDTIVKFVDTYNSLIEKVRGELEEKRYRDFQPLTKEQKDSMDEKDIERWEEKAKSGTLRGDSILSGALSKMREDLYTAVSGLTGITQLSQIGITTSDNYRDGGKLEIDPDKLKATLTANPNAVYEIFAKKGSNSSENGLGNRLRETIDTTMKNIEKRAGKVISVNNSFTLGRTLNNIENQIYRFEERLIQVEDRYWRQFTAMEKAIQRANSQSMYLMQQFGGGM
jgi:flagellar hook-associated protein 2